MHFTPGHSDQCLVCGSDAFSPFRERSDGVLVVMCDNCGMGMVETIPSDLESLYGDAYYAGGTGAEVGYDAYAMTAEHSVAWAAALIRLLAPPGRILDIGSADGHLLRKLLPDYECFGVEMNPEMADRSRSAGVEVLASDIYDPSLLRDHADSFDVATSLAVFEHTRDIRRAVEIAGALLREGGLLLFEVPLVGTAVDDAVWFRSSLEHVWYPTEQGLRYLFDSLGLSLVGVERQIVGFASTFVGVAARGEAQPVVEDRFRTLTSGQIVDGQGDDARFHVLFDLVHAGQTDVGTVTSLSSLEPSDVNELLLTRLGYLWSVSENARQVAEHELAAALTSLADVRDYAVALEAARDEAREQAIVARREGDAVAERLDRVLSSTTFGRTAPLIDGWGPGSRRAAQIRYLIPLLSLRRLRTVAKLALRGDFVGLRERARVLAAGGLDRGSSRQNDRTPLALQAEPWPADVPLVSVVVVCFNYGAFVDEAISSVLAQTAVGHCEVLVVDGGSDDPATIGKMRELAKDPPPRTKVLLREDERHLVGDNRNFGIARARGRYVACLDADDLLDPRYVEIALYLLERRGYDAVSTTTLCFGSRTEFFDLMENPDLSDMLRANYLTTVAVFRRELWERAGGFHDVGLGVDYFYEDWKFWIRIAALGARMTNIRAPLFRYRTHSTESLSQQGGAVRDIAAHRAAVTEFNDDVISPEALAESARRRGLEITVEGGIENLKLAEQDHRPTILIAFPFLTIGGAERLLSAVAKHLANAGYRIVITTTIDLDPAFGDSSSWFEDATAEIYLLPRMLHPDYWADFLEYVVDTKSVDALLIVGSEFVYHELPELRQRHPELRVADLLFNTQGHVRNNRRYSGQIDLHLCESAEVRDWLVAHGQDEASIRVIESGVDTSEYKPVERKRDSRLRVGFSGRLSEEKAPLAFVDLARVLSGPDFHFAMTGAGPLESAVRRRAAGLSDDSFRILGVVDDIRAHLASLDVLVLPSILDGRPVVVLEALALGVPVIASRVGGLPALVRDGETGFLVEPGNVSEIAKHLRRLAVDRDELDRLQRSARTFAERNLDVEVMHSAYEQALQGLLS